MNQLVKFWVNLVTSMEAKVEDVPAKLKSQVIGELINIGFINGDDLAEVKKAKIAEMDISCNSKIQSGFDISLSDGSSHHFSLEIPDQLKISKLNDMANSGVEELPYHADGETCKFYSKEDVAAINQKMEETIEFQVTYFNSLRDYINSLEDINVVQEIQYGIEIPEQYQSEVLKALIEQSRAE